MESLAGPVNEANCDVYYLNTVVTVLSAASKDVLVRLVFPKMASEANPEHLISWETCPQPPVLCAYACT